MPVKIGNRVIENDLANKHIDGMGKLGLNEKFRDHPNFKRYTEVFLIDSANQNRICLGRKLRGFKAGKIFGYGGKIEPSDPTVVAAALREVEEEAGVQCTAIEEVGRIFVDFVDQIKGESTLRMEIFAFRCTDWDGEIEETDEMSPIWYNSVKDIPWDECMADCISWYPKVFDFEKPTRFLAKYILDTQTDELLYERVDTFDGNLSPDILAGAGMFAVPTSSMESANPKFLSQQPAGTSSNTVSHTKSDEPKNRIISDKSVSNDATNGRIKAPVMDLISMLNAQGRESDIHFDAFKVRWYNDVQRRIGRQPISVKNEDCLALVGYSGPAFFEKCVVPTYCKKNNLNVCASSVEEDMLSTALVEGDPNANDGAVLAATDSVIQIVKNFFVHLQTDVEQKTNEDVSKVFTSIKISKIDSKSIDANGNEKACFNVETIGKVLFTMEYIDPLDFPKERFESVVVARDPEIWGENNRTLEGLAIHPNYGGYFNYRVIVVLPSFILTQKTLFANVDVPMIPKIESMLLKEKPESLRFLSDEQRAEALEEYNLERELGCWRDISNPKERYSALAYMYFSEKSQRKRTRCLQLLEADRKRII